MILTDGVDLAFEKYLQACSDFWARVDANRASDNGYVVVDLMHNNANLLLGELVVGRFVAQLRGARLAAVVCDHFLGWPSPVAQVRRLGTAFGVERFYEIDINPVPANTLWASVASWFDPAQSLLRRLARLKGAPLRRAILDLTIEGVPVGDLAYDSYLRKTAAASIETFDSELREVVREASVRLKQYRAIMGDPSNFACLVSDNGYVDFGGLLRTATVLGKTGYAKVLAWPSSVRKYRTSQQCYDFPWPRADDLKFIRSRLGPELTRKADGFFPPRRQLADEHLYFKIAYGDQMARLAAAELRGRLGLSEQASAVAIMVPMFDDAPHCIPDLLYEDTGRWLEATLAICASVDNVVWLVRNHPQAVSVELKSEFDRIVLPYTARCPHIRICPSDISTESLFPVLSACVTVASTAGNELASVGIPGVICGRPYYADLGFMVRPRDRQEYASILRDISHLPPLTPEQITVAKEIAYAYFHCTFQASNLLPPGADLTGQSIRADGISQYWDVATDLMLKYDFQHDPMWQNFKRMEELGRSLLLRFDEIELMSASRSSG